jgi:hypothetical protein
MQGNGNRNVNKNQEQILDFMSKGSFIYLLILDNILNKNLIKILYFDTNLKTTLNKQNPTQQICSQEP